MALPTKVDLYGLLPEFMRRADVERGTPLGRLLAAAKSQADLVRADIVGLQNNFFVETCDDWVLPYIADLIALTLIADEPANNRRDVARTIAYRRRKGTVPQLETMARDVTGYDCRVVEFFTRMIWSECMFHLRVDDRATVDVRDRAALARIGTAFDRLSHYADLRPATERQGWYNIRKLGFFLWRLRAIPLRAVEAAPAPGPAPAGAYHCNVLGQPEPLFQAPAATERPADAQWPRVDEFGVSAPIAPWLFRERPDQYWQTASPPSPAWAGPRGVDVFTNGARIAQSVVPADLCDWSVNPPAGSVAVDVRLGRLRFNSGEVPAAGAVVTVSYFFGLSGPCGGGGYDRDTSLPLNPGEVADVRDVTSTGVGTPISTALTSLAASAARVRVVNIKDSRTYRGETLPLPATFETLIVQADSGERATLLLTGPVFGGGAVSGKILVLRGLLITGLGQTMTFPDGIERIVLEDCTIDPGGGLSADGRTARGAGVTLAVAAPGDGITLEVTRSIVGPLALPAAMTCVHLRDSIADAQAFAGQTVLHAGPPAALERCTLFGAFDCYRLEASESLFVGSATALRRQEGCVRFCYFAPGSETPRRFRCVPESPPPEASPPVFTSTAFGDPGYAQLTLNCPVAIATGGETGSELGVWASLGGARRLEHLKLRLAEYLPAGLVPVFIFQS